ncbi:metal ABC transporter solute-binding protein, Zn/Mn family [Holdemania filiformis]|uniref:metal ABC transporter solute-binding protein, Zn/Mn family n=1 Tax=Holdemania filiformis TaxID=61171 RepID=UPI00266FBC57|nr:zinc ABC transporter substrate-binding protein [Holdemania filiformis]
MNPIAMTSMAKKIRDWQCENYVEESRYFEENYSQLESELVRLDAEYQSLSSTLKNEKKTIKFVSMTASFGNWQKTYGIQVYPVILSKYGVLPNEKQLDIIKTKIVEDNVKYIAYEPNMTEDMLALFDQLSAELNLQRVDLSNLSSLSADQREDNKDYLSIMVENLNQLESMAEDDLTPAVQEPAADDQAANEDEDA